MSETPFKKPSRAHLMTYHIARGEQGVLTYEPYKSHLLQLWRFRTIPIARASSEALWDKFLQFYEEADFVGMDMSRKFIQMGMTRSKRYANYKGGRKYVDGKAGGVRNEKSKDHEGKEEKEEVSRIFKAVWERCKAHEGYGELKKVFLKEQKDWDDVKREDNEGKGRDVESSNEGPQSKESPKRKTRSRIKTESS